MKKLQLITPGTKSFYPIFSRGTITISGTLSRWYTSLFYHGQNIQPAFAFLQVKCIN